ncbi:MAG: hypothetical protein CVU05_02495 [Bacteroidetes bacterium HGW-Bacteroidetes-21]|jgi:hypothetical protein|nr:MAG: hypothetical protein CVU05_02495 [Bacteroidetes bacterium HGW-Bacteroidetes-21]
MAQFDYIDQKALYVTHKIKSIISVYHDEDTNENREIWKIDSTGRMISYQLHTLWGETYLGSTEWKYNGTLLSTCTDIGDYGKKNHKIDTARTIYLYNDSQLLVKTKFTWPIDEDTLITEYKYINGLIICESIFYGNYQNGYKTYSYEDIVSTKSKTVSITEFYNNNVSFIPFIKTMKYYDTLGIIQTEIEYNFIKECSIPSIIKTFIYDNGKLIRIKELYIVDDSDKPHEYNDEIFEYNEKGLVSKVLTINNGSSESYCTYEYE